MKTSITFAFLTLTIVCATATRGAGQKVNEPDATPALDQLLEKYVEAIGGRAAIQKIASRVSKGTFQLSGLGAKGTVELYEKAPNKSVLIMAIPGIAVVQEGFNGTIAWEIEPGNNSPRDKMGNELAEARHEADFYKSLKLKQQYPRMILKGREKIADRQVYVVEAPRNGNAKRWYFDAQSWLLVRVDSDAVSSTGKSTTRVYYDDYTEVDGVKIPFTLRKEDEEESVAVKLTEVKHNIPIEDAKFDKPAAPSDKPVPATRGSDKAVHVIPFELHENLIYFKARVGPSEPLSVVLDTGASKCAISERRAREIGLKLFDLGEVADVGSGEGKTRVAFTNDVSFNMSEAGIFAKQVMVIPVDYLESFEGRAIDALIGYEVFVKYVVEIDYQAKVIRLHDPETFRYSGRGEIVPIRLVDTTPLVHAGIVLPGNKRLEGEFEVDTGKDTALLLLAPFVRKHNLLTSGQTVIPTFGAGVGGERREVTGRLQAFQLGSLVINNPTIEFSLAASGALSMDTYDGQIGGEVLRRFKVIFDYSRLRMILEPNPSLAEPYEYDMSGAYLIAAGTDFKTLRVHRVFDKTPASEAGLREGDVIAAVDDKPAAQLTLEEVRRMFKQEGRRYLLGVKRGAQFLQIRMTIRRLI